MHSQCLSRSRERSLYFAGDADRSIALPILQVMLTEAFKPRDNLLNPDGSAKRKQNVSGKAFVTAMRTLISDFGNVDPGFLAKVDQIAKESEAVASALFNVNEDMDVRELQDEAFHKRSISVSLLT